MSEPVVQSLLRLPISLKTKIEQAAKENNRSINAETIVRLEKSFEEQAVSFGMSLDDYKKAAQEVFKETVLAHMKQHDDRREQNLIEMTHQQAYIIKKLTEELEELRKKNS